MKRIILILLLINISLYANDYEYVNNFKQMQGDVKSNFNDDILDQFEDKLAFKISNASLKLDPIGGFADGIYKLHNANLEQISKHEYKLVLDLVLKKKKYLMYNRKETLYILYNKRRFWIKRDNNVYKYSVPQDDVKFISKNGITLLKKVKLPLEVKLDGLNMIIEFLE